MRAGEGTAAPMFRGSPTESKKVPPHLSPALFTVWPTHSRGRLHPGTRTARVPGIPAAVPHNSCELRQSVATETSTQRGKPQCARPSPLVEGVAQAPPPVSLSFSMQPSTRRPFPKREFHPEPAHSVPTD